MEDRDLKPMQPWGPTERTIWVGERDPMTGRVPVHLPNNGPHPGGSFLRGLFEDWRREKNPQEYAAGFRARMAEIADSDGAHPSWRSGWNDADTELLEQARHRCWLEESREDNLPGTRRLLFDAGRQARENGVPFDEARTEPWERRLSGCGHRDRRGSGALNCKPARRKAAVCLLSERTNPGIRAIGQPSATGSALSAPAAAASFPAVPRYMGSRTR